MVTTATYQSFVKISVAYIEKSISSNNIDMLAGPITAAGQLIPLFVGVYVFIITLISVLETPTRRWRMTSCLLRLSNAVADLERGRDHVGESKS